MSPDFDIDLKRVDRSVSPCSITRYNMPVVAQCALNQNTNKNILFGVKINKILRIESGKFLLFSFNGHRAIRSSQCLPI